MTEQYPDYPDVVAAIVVIDCQDPMRLATFWGELLGRKIVEPAEHWVNLEWAPRFGMGLSFQRSTEKGKQRLHIDVFAADVEATRTRVEELGGRHADGYGGDHVMCDPEGNVFCVIPPPGA